MDKALVSIVIPVFNAAKYLARCVESALGQTYEALEIILVDDGSTDGSSLLCDLLAKKHNNVKAVHKPNGGLSSARNTGIKKAKGKYVAFLDADDMLHVQCIEFLFEMIEKSNSEIACCGMHNFKNESLSLTLEIFSPFYKFPSFPTAISGPDATARMLYQKHPDNSACGKLFSKELILDIPFREGTWYEDLDWTPRVFIKAKSVVFTYFKMYYYRQHSGSYTHTFSLRRKDVLEVTQRLEDTMKGNPLLLKAARSRRLSANFNLFCLISSNIRTLKEEEREEAEKTCINTWNTIRMLRMESLLDSQVRFKNKMAIILSLIGGKKLISLLSYPFYS